MKMDWRYMKKNRLQCKKNKVWSHSATVPSGAKYKTQTKSILYIILSRLWIRSV